MKIKSDIKRILLTFCFYGAWFFGAYGFLCLAGMMLTGDPIYVWWALANGIITGILVAVIFIEYVYDLLDGDR